MAAMLREQASGLMHNAARLRHTHHEESRAMQLEASAQLMHEAALALERSSAGAEGCRYPMSYGERCKQYPDCVCGRSPGSSTDYLHTQLREWWLRSNGGEDHAAPIEHILRSLIRVADGKSSGEPRERQSDPGHALRAQDISESAFRDMPNPTEDDLKDWQFNAIWEAIKSWDVNAPFHYQGYCGANGSHAMLILNMLRARSPHEPGDRLDPDYKLPCDVKLPPNTVIGRNCKLSTLMHALKNREGQDLPRFLAQIGAAPSQDELRRKAVQIVENAHIKRDHLTHCDKVMGDSHACTCGMDAYARMLQKLDSPSTKEVVQGEKGDKHGA